MENVKVQVQELPAELLEQMEACSCSCKGGAGAGSGAC